ncbi:unnamed protein product, partial [Prorocentrum cordatum]
MAEAGTAAERLHAWKALMMLDGFLLWKGFRRGGKGRGGIRQNASERAIAERLALFWAGQWAALARPAQETIRPARRRRGPVPPERIRELVDDGAWRLLAALRGGAPMLDSPDDDDFQKAVAQELREASPHAAAGRDGSRATHWQVGSGDAHVERLLASTLKHWLDGEAPAELDDIFSRQTLFVLRKSNGGVLPIAVGAFLGRLALRALLRCKRQEVQDTVSSMQFALGRAGGADAAFKALNVAAASGNCKAVLSLDIKNAYGTVRRRAAQEAVWARAPWMSSLIDRLLTATTRNAYDTADGDTIWVEQGTGLVAYADDLYIVGPAANLAASHDVLATELARVGLQFAPEKTKVWLASPEAAQTLPATLHHAVVPDLPVLGCTLYHHDREGDLAAGFGNSEQGMQKAAALVRATAATLKDARKRGLCCQVAGAILRYVTVGAPQHLLRSRLWSEPALAAYGTAVADAWAELIGVHLTPEQTAIGNLPLRDGGVAFGLAAPRASAAFHTGWRRHLWRQCAGAPLYTEQGLRAAFPGLAAELAKANADLTTRAPALVGDVKLDFIAEPHKRMQRMITDAVNLRARENILASVQEPWRARLRQAGGAGARGFLCVPLPGNEAIADGAWRAALRRRLLCTVEQIVFPARAETHCQGSSPRGACGARLDGLEGLAHAEGCKIGGEVVGGNNEIRDIMWRFIKAYIDPRALREQRLESLRAQALVDATVDDEARDVLDVVFNYDGRRVAIHVAVVGARADLPRIRAAASRGGAAAAEEERAKRRRYAGLNISPCVLELGGRPGESAQATVRMLAVMAGGESRASALAAGLWQQVSIAVQASVAWRIASAYARPDSMSLAGSRTREDDFAETTAGETVEAAVADKTAAAMAAEVAALVHSRAAESVADQVGVAAVAALAAAVAVGSGGGAALMPRQRDKRHHLLGAPTGAPKVEARRARRRGGEVAAEGEAALEVAVAAETDARADAPEVAVAAGTDAGSNEQKIDTPRARLVRRREQRARADAGLQAAWQEQRAARQEAAVAAPNSTEVEESQSPERRIELRGGTRIPSTINLAVNVAIITMKWWAVRIDEKNKPNPWGTDWSWKRAISDVRDFDVRFLCCFFDGDKESLLQFFRSCGAFGARPLAAPCTMKWGDAPNGRSAPVLRPNCIVPVGPCDIIIATCEETQPPPLPDWLRGVGDSDVARRWLPAAEIPMWEWGMGRSRGIRARYRRAALIPIGRVAQKELAPVSFHSCNSCGGLGIFQEAAEIRWRRRIETAATVAGVGASAALQTAEAFAKYVEATK